MAGEVSAVRVKALSDVLGGSDPIDFLYSLLEVGGGRLYVKIPDGFRCEYKEPRNLFAHRLRHDEPLLEPQVRLSHWPSYVQLSRGDVDRLIEKSSITVQVFSDGALFRCLSEDGRPTRDLHYARIRSGELQPETRTAMDATPFVRDATADCFTVVKGYKKDSNIPYYALQGVDFGRVYVEEHKLSRPVEAGSLRVADVEVSPSEGLPEDPFLIRNSSPLLYEILRCAFDSRIKKSKGNRSLQLAAHFNALDAGYPKNPTPFGDKKRATFASNLANPDYKYPAPSIKGKKLEPTFSVPETHFFKQQFINERLAKVLYAACRWSGAIEPGLHGDLERLVDLLVGLGFADRDETDQVQSSIFFITGEMYQRNKLSSYFRHERGESRNSRVR